MGSPSRTLKRTAGWVHLWALGVGGVISGNYFGWQTGLLTGGFGGLLIATIFIAAMYVCLVFSIAELSAALPDAGGFYNFTRAAFGKDRAFLNGLTDAIEYVTTPAVIVAGIAGYMKALSPGSSDWVWWVVFYSTFVLINVSGAAISFSVSVGITVLAALVLAVFYGGALAGGAFSWSLALNIPPEPGKTPFLPHGWYGIFAALPYAVWFYLAIEQLPLSAEESYDAARDMPRALKWGIVTLLLLSVGTLVLNSGVGPGAKGVGASAAPLEVGFRAVFARNVTSTLLSAVSLTGLIASFHAIIYAYGRLLFALSRAGYLPSFLSRIGARRTPWAALLSGGGAGLCLCFLARQYAASVGAALLNMAVFGALLSYILVLVFLPAAQVRPAPLTPPLPEPLGKRGSRRRHRSGPDLPCGDIRGTFVPPRCRRYCRLRCGDAYLLLALSTPSCGGRVTFRELQQAVKRGAVDTVIAAFADHYGRLLGKRFDAEFFVAHTAAGGTHACNYLLTTDMEMEPVPGFQFANWERGYGDFHLVPDLATLRRLSWLDKTALVHCDVEHEAGHLPVDVAPRAILKKQIARATASGYEALAASELEYFAYRTSYRQAAQQEYRDLEPLGWYLEDYNLLQGTREEFFTSAVRRHLKTSGIVSSRDPKQLLATWQGWHTVGAPMRKDYQRLVELSNKGAKELGFADTGALWRSKYDMPPDEFAREVDRLWDQVRPLYEKLHAFVRWKLREKYGAAVVPEKGPIPAHLLGNVWAQQWGEIYPLLAPKTAAAAYDLTAILKARRTDAVQMVRYGEGFFTSLGFEPLPKTFWERSLFTRPRDRDVVCHASAWDVDNVNDLRIKCALMSGRRISMSYTTSSAITSISGHTTSSLSCSAIAPMTVSTKQ